ncbi:hypothetical protein WMY93_033234 [Mugilogobius chulae]|uniref:Methionine adenosyltransferase 2 subunit beta n=1 Tax=Mugilogobius chulae TaxID=88201 RepID=A0AAW0MKQ1_9GOBI
MALHTHSHGACAEAEQEAPPAAAAAALFHSGPDFSSVSAPCSSAAEPHNAPDSNPRPAGLPWSEMPGFHSGSLSISGSFSPSDVILYVTRACCRKRTVFMKRFSSEMKVRLGLGPVVDEESEGAGPGAGGRVLVTGATGLLGRSLCRQLRDDGWIVIATGFSRARPTMLCCDLTNEEQVHHVIAQHKPEIIVHCAAERRPDVVERSSDSALNLNVQATALLAKEAASSGAFFIYISTDYVFDGRNPPYGEDDAPNPLNLYGRSKMEGERETQRYCPDSVILRVPILFGEVEQVSESAVTTLWTQILDQTQTCSLDHLQQRFPTDVRDVSRVCNRICSRRRQDPSLRGVFHFLR